MSSSGSVVVSARPQIQHFATFCCFSVGFKSVCSGARFDDEPPAAAPPPSALRGELRSGLGAAPPRSASCSASLLLVALLQAADALQQRALVARRLVEVAPWSHHSCFGGLDARFPMFRFSKGVTRNFRNISEKFASEIFRIFRRATLSNPDSPYEGFLLYEFTTSEMRQHLNAGNLSPILTCFPLDPAQAKHTSV